MTSRLVNLCIDANDVPRLARFWATALQWEIEDETADEIGVQPTDGTPFRLLFLPVPELKVGKNASISTSRARPSTTRTSWSRSCSRSAVATSTSARTPTTRTSVLADPEGNELCIIDPGNKFLAGTGRLGRYQQRRTASDRDFWSKVLGWPLVWDQDEETAIRSPDLTGPLITWSGPPLIPKTGKNRIHLDVPAAGRRGSAVGGRANHGSRSEADRHR